MTLPLNSSEKREPYQRIETTNVSGNWCWQGGIGLPIDFSGNTLQPRASQKDAEIDELIAKGILAQQQLRAFNAKLCSYFRFATATYAPGNRGIKERHSIQRKWESRNVDEAGKWCNDIARATIRCSTVEECLQVADWVLEQEEFAPFKPLVDDENDQQWGYLNRYVDPFKIVDTRLTGEYQDIKFFLAFKVDPARTRQFYTGELQINTQTTLLFKEDVSHKFYEVIRTFPRGGQTQIKILDDEQRKKLVKDLRHAANSLSSMDAHTKLNVSGAPGQREEILSRSAPPDADGRIPRIVWGRAAANISPHEVQYAIRCFVRDTLLGYKKNYKGIAIISHKHAAFLRDHVAPLVWEDHQIRSRRTMVYSNGTMVPLKGGRAMPDWLRSWR